MQKQIHIIAGPNGAGKSSHARVSLLPQFLKSNEFINADEIAKMLYPDNVNKATSRAGRLMIKRIRYLMEEGQGFAFETTLSAKTYIKLIYEAREQNYNVNLIFLKLENPDLAINRVATRVSKGGHNVDSATIIRRFARGVENLKDYLAIVDTALIYEASGLELIEIAKKMENKFTIINQNLWSQIDV